LLCVLFSLWSSANASVSACKTQVRQWLTKYSEHPECDQPGGDGSEAGKEEDTSEEFEEELAAGWDEQLPAGSLRSLAKRFMRLIFAPSRHDVLCAISTCKSSNSACCASKSQMHVYRELYTPTAIAHICTYACISAIDYTCAKALYIYVTGLQPTEEGGHLRFLPRACQAWSLVLDPRGTPTTAGSVQGRRGDVSRASAMVLKEACRLTVGKT